MKDVLCMSEQMPDLFKWNKKEYIFIGASDIYTLFDPKRYGLEPEAPYTACWKGFIIYFSVRKEQLYIDKLEVHCDNGIYPKINGVKAKDKTRFRNFHVYNKLNIPLKYTGTIIIGEHLNERFRNRAFTGPHSYDITYELKFEEGILLDFKETSGTYDGF